MQVVTRIIALVLILYGALAAGGPLGAQEVTPPRPLASAMQAMRGGDWDTARALALRDGQAALDVIEWHRLRAGHGTAAEVMAFLERNPDWPGLDWLRQKSEAAFAEADRATVLAFFDGELPQTGAGALLHAEALLQANERGAANAELVLAWRTMQLDAIDTATFLARHGDVLAPHHAARLDMALWHGWEEDARRMLPLVDEGQQALAHARMALRGDRDGVDARIAAIPPGLLDDPGLAFERFAWRARRGRTDDAVALLLMRSTGAEALGEPSFWADRRRALARDVMRDGDAATAYRIASSHYLVEGADFADLEWLSGFLALRRLDRPDLAVLHFTRFRDAVATPISLGRAGYWLGLAQEAAGNPEGAREAYALGAAHQTSFYGLLAAERGGLPPDPTLSGQEPFAPWRDAAFTRSSVYRAAVLLLAAGETTLAERFLTHLAESQDRVTLGQMGAMLAELDQPHLSVMLGKRAAQYGINLPGPYYALHPMAQDRHPVPTEMALSIARRESEFDPRVVSGAGARGLMQVMPATARQVVRRLGLDYDDARMLSDWRYNARIGGAYLAALAEQFAGNVVMMSAAYNAGPSRPIRWMEQFGDPRKGEVDVIDWIEMIPFNETRNYVMRVAESLPVYRARLGKPPHPVPFSQELAGSTLLPLSP